MGHKIKFESQSKSKGREVFEWDVDDLPAYVDENSDDLHARIIGESKSVRLMNTVEGIKGTQAVQLLDDALGWQTGDGCGFNPSDNDALSQTTLSTANIKAEKEFCNNTLVGFWAQRKLAPGAGKELETLPFEQILLDRMIERNARMVENAIWKSDTTLLNDDLNRFDGLEKIIANATGIIDLNPANTASFTTSNALDIVLAAYTAMGEDLTSNPKFGMYMNWDYMFKLIQNMITLNLFHYDPKTMDLMDYIVIPGTSCKIWRIPGLSTSTDFYAGLIGAEGEFLVGTDTMSDFTAIQSGYDTRLQSLWYRFQFRLGVNIVFANQVGRWTPGGIS